MKKNNSFIETILRYGIVLLTILDSVSVYSVMVTKNIPITEILVVLLALQFLLIDFKKIILQRKLKKNSALFIFAYLIYIFGYIIFGSIVSSMTKFLIKFIVIFILLYLHFSTDSNEVKKYKKTFINIMVIIAITSLMFYVLGSLLKLINPTSQVLYRWGSLRNINSYFNLYFETQKETFFNYTVYRNTAIFTEAPMYNLLLLISVLLCLFYKDKKYNKYLLLFIITIITTFSTTGFILTIVMFMIKSILKNDKYSIRKTMIFLPIVVLMIILSFNIYNQKSDSRSYSVRIDDYRASYISWKENIVFGNGYGNNEVFKSNISSFRINNTGQSSSIGAILSQGGIYLLMFYLFPVILLLIKYKENKKIEWTLYVYLILFFTTIFQYTCIQLTISAILYTFCFNKKVRGELNEC